MSRRAFSLIFLAVLAFCVLCGGYVVLRPPADPVVQGKRLSIWITEFNIWQWPPTGAAALALKDSGDKPKELLANMIHQRDRGFVPQIRQWLAKWKALKIKSIPPSNASQQRALGVCNLLGTNVQAVSPAIARLINDYPSRINDANLVSYSIRTLGVMGSEGAVALASLLQHSNVTVRVEVAALLGTMPYGDQPEVLTELQRCAVRGDAALQAAAKLSLELIKRRGEQHLSFALNAPNNSATPTNLWSIARGVRVTATSGFQPSYNGTEAFESFSGSPEGDALVFQEPKPDGFVHFMEWKTVEPVTLRSLGFVAGHDSANGLFERAFREIRLLVFDEGVGQFKEFYAELVNVPYGRGNYCSALASFRNLSKPVTGQRFRVELVQNGSRPFPGPRLIELYGFDQPATQELARKAMQNQKPPYRDALEPTVANLE